MCSIGGKNQCASHIYDHRYFACWRLYWIHNIFTKVCAIQWRKNFTNNQKMQTYIYNTSIMTSSYPKYQAKELKCHTCTKGSKRNKWMKMCTDNHIVRQQYETNTITFCLYYSCHLYLLVLFL